MGIEGIENITSNGFDEEQARRQAVRDDSARAAEDAKAESDLGSSVPDDRKPSDEEDVEQKRRRLAREDSERVRDAAAEHNRVHGQLNT